MLMIGGGPANLALGVAIEEVKHGHDFGKIVLLEREDSIVWHKNMLFSGALSQVSFLKDLVTLRDPTSKFSFLNFLHKNKRLEKFVNLQCFFPYRSEISDYLQWVANSLTKVEISYSTEVLSIDPVLSNDRKVHGWHVKTANGCIYKAKKIIYGSGRSPNIPNEFNNINQNKAFHSSQCLKALEEFTPENVKSIAVIGGAQSSAEVYQMCIDKFKNAKIKLIMRSIGLINYESSKFANELYMNNYIDVFFTLDAEIRQKILSEMHTSNYAGVAPPTLESLYRYHYLQDLNGTNRATIHTQCHIKNVKEFNNGVELEWHDSVKNTNTQEHFDFIVLGTGYSNKLPNMVSDLGSKLDLDTIEVTRNYKAKVPCSDGVALYLQGVNEGSHGIADSLLSVLGTRSFEIMNDIIEQDKK